MAITSAQSIRDLNVLIFLGFKYPVPESSYVSTITSTSFFFTNDLTDSGNARIDAPAPIDKAAFEERIAAPGNLPDPAIVNTLPAEYLFRSFFLTGSPVIASSGSIR